MSWIENIVPPKIRSLLNKREIPENYWIKCPESGELVYIKDLEENQYVVPNSGYHMKVKARDRLRLFLDDGVYTELANPQVAFDPLKFRDVKRYSDRLKENRTKTGTEDSIVAASGKLLGLEVTVAVHEYDFVGGSLGMAAGQAIIAAMERAVKARTPFIIFTASGGARMQEGILSLMQMPRTTIAVQRLREAGLPYIVVMTNPTTGGVSASYAMLGDIHIAEPGAVIGFAGARVIQDTIREKLPAGFQRSEYLLEHGMIDMVVHRHDLRATIGSLIAIFTKQPVPEELKRHELPAPRQVTMRDVVVAAEGDDDLLNAPVAGNAE
jgi:acetyl-CoA carboxylase carboxyl transferase subunit beta